MLFLCLRLHPAPASTFDATDPTTLAEAFNSTPYPVSCFQNFGVVFLDHTVGKSSCERITYSQRTVRQYSAVKLYHLDDQVMQVWVWVQDTPYALVFRANATLFNSSKHIPLSRLCSNRTGFPSWYPQLRLSNLDGNENAAAATHAVSNVRLLCIDPAAITSIMMLVVMFFSPLFLLRLRTSICWGMTVSRSSSNGCA